MVFHKFHPAVVVPHRNLGTSDFPIRSFSSLTAAQKSLHSGKIQIRRKLYLLVNTRKDRVWNPLHPIVPSFRTDS